MISWMFINVNTIVIILLNIFKKYEKIKNDALDNGNIIWNVFSIFKISENWK